jgi:excisionase family DNA binding protein
MQPELIGTWNRNIMKNDPSKWLTLTQTAELLGVHPSTVRSWSDKGQVPVHRTEGRHRRYRRSEIELWERAARQDHATGSENIAQHALRQIHFKIREGLLESEPWYQKLDDEARQQYRKSGVVLVQGLVNFLSCDRENAIAEASSLGYEYASRGRRYGLDHIDAMRAYLFFRNLLLEAIICVYLESNIQEGTVWQGMLSKFHAFTDQIMLSLLETYQAFENAHR